MITDFLANAWEWINAIPADDWPWLLAAIAVVLFLGRGKKKRR